MSAVVNLLLICSFSVRPGEAEELHPGQQQEGSNAAEAADLSLFLVLLSLPPPPLPLPPPVEDSLGVVVVQARR